LYGNFRNWIDTSSTDSIPEEGLDDFIAPNVVMSCVEFIIPEGDGKCPGRIKKQSGSWTCPDCGNLNLPFRQVCNLRYCRRANPNISQFPENAWVCSKCGNVNYDPNRRTCNMRKCKMPRY